MNILTKLEELSPEIINIIQCFIPRESLIFTNRENYFLYHHFLKKYIKKYENYIRDTIRRDNYFVFGIIVKENFEKWITINQYMYKNMIFKNYLYFTMHYCIENESSNCRTIIMDYLKERGLDKNLYKKNLIKYIKWKN
jgi:hypothetical protein